MTAVTYNLKNHPCNNPYCDILYSITHKYKGSNINITTPTSTELYYSSPTICSTNPLPSPITSETISSAFIHIQPKGLSPTNAVSTDCQSTNQTRRTQSCYQMPIDSTTPQIQVSSLSTSSPPESRTMTKSLLCISHKLPEIFPMETQQNHFCFLQTYSYLCSEHNQ